MSLPSAKTTDDSVAERERTHLEEAWCVDLLFTEGKVVVGDDVAVLNLERDVWSIGREAGGDRITMGEDPTVSRTHATLRRTRSGGFEICDMGTKHGTWVEAKQLRPNEWEPVADNTMIVAGRAILMVRRLHRSADPPSSAGFIGCSARLNELVEYLTVAARGSSPTLLVGPTGVGKEVCARAIHRLGPRSSGPFVPVNCAGIPDNLAESELFGHVAGAFTNARERRFGAFERANGGTLFLDELEAFPVHLQPKILRAIQDREVTPIGGQRPIRCDFALASATNESPDALLKDGRLRKDLYARLRGFVVEVPTLRDRRSDILRIAASILGTEHPLCSYFLARAMLNCDWPLNVRELIEFAKSVAPLGKNSPASVRKEIVEKFIDDHFPESKDSQGEPARDQIVAALRKHAGKVMPAAKDLACERTKFYRLLEQHGVRPADYRG